jgi:tetratricopeptide (TPR) repeat protein
MKTSPGTGHLSPKELADLLNGKTDANSNARIKKLLNDCELSKEALAGFTAVPGAAADLNALNKQIAVKSGMIKTPVWMSVVTVVIGVALVVGMGYALWPREPEVLDVPLAYTVPPVNTPAPDVRAVDLTPKAEHFVNPEAKPKPLAVLSERKPADTATTTSTDVKADPITVPVAEPLEVKPVVPKNPEAGYNASIGFIQDLKVTEFEKYYRKTIEVRELPLKGVPAEFENEDKFKKGNELETVRNVPAEQFLNDALRAFHDGKYGRCIEKMEVLKKNNGKDLNAAFYMGVSYVKLEMFEKAIKMFDEVLNASNNVFHEEAKWYKALALIGNGDDAAAKVLLTEIAAKDGFYKEKAVLKLKELQ